jgi:phage-related protein
MSTNVGAVDFELLLNSNPFNKGIKTATNTIKSSGIENSLKKIGKLAVAAFSVKTIINFGKECINLGSDLTEVQNVVDVTFGSLNTEVNKFAENAITQFGLGQTVTKKYVGTFGAMAKAFNFSNKEALAMSETLTGLTGDVASFYNLSSNEAYTKLKSVFTGETETLKDLGVVMTQNALDQYALANGYGRTTSQMSEQEKVALRYKFVLDKLNIANGDFARTSDSWANQTRVLSLRFNELKATLGQGFINIFTPIVKGINLVLSKLQVLANAFKSFTEMIFGNAGGDGGSSAVSDLATDASNASYAVSGIGESAKKSAKDLKSLASFDTAQVLKNDSDDSSSSGSGAGGIEGFDFGDTASSAMEQANTQMDKFINKAKELVSIFKQGFSEGFGDFDFSSITNSIEGIKNNLKEIFTSPEVLNASNNWTNTVILNLGRVVGSVASIGVTIADNLLGGFNLFLEQNKEDLQGHIVRLFDLSSQEAEIKGKFAVTVADVFSVFRGDAAKQITADIMAIFTDSFLGIKEIAWQAGNDILYIITEPINENKDLIKQTLEGLFEPISSVLGTIKQGVQDTFAKFWEVYDQYIKPAVENIKNGFSSILETVLTAWNENLKPVLDEWTQKFNELWTQHIQPMINSFLDFIGKLNNGISELWNKWLVPIINWIIKNVIPVVSPIIKEIENTVMNVFGKIEDILKGFWDTLSGIIDFIVGVFTGDWNKAWNGIKETFNGIWQIIKGNFDIVWESIKGIVKTAIDVVKGVIQISLNYIKTIWQNIWNGIKNFVSNIWNGIKGIFSGTGQWFSNIFQQAYNGITRVFSNIGNFFSGIWQRIKETFSNLGTSIGNAISNAVKSGINGVISLIERTINKAINLINGAIGIINLIPGVKVSKIGNLNLPRLAQGGYVKANTPQLAMIGDNRHQGEVVAPEDKLMSLYKKANQEMGLGNNEKVIELLEKIIQILINLSLDFNLYIDGYELNKRLEKIKNKNRFATNGG